MDIIGTETSLKMFEKFLSSEGGLKIAHKYSEDIMFGLNELQTIPKSHQLYPSGMYHVFIDILFNVNSKVMIKWENQPTQKMIQSDLNSWLPVFGFPSNVNTEIIGYRKVD
jgi:hypothetical protein